jgi:hypothetical protein
MSAEQTTESLLLNSLTHSIDSGIKLLAAKRECREGEWGALLDRIYLHGRAKAYAYMRLGAYAEMHGTGLRETAGALVDETRLAMVADDLRSLNAEHGAADAADAFRLVTAAALELAPEVKLEDAGERWWEASQTATGDVE